MSEHEYEVKDMGGNICLQFRHYTVAQVYYEADRVKCPLSEEEANELMDIIKCWVETKHPASELNEEDYEPSPHSKEFIKFLEWLAED